MLEFGSVSPRLPSQNSRGVISPTCSSYSLEQAPSPHSASLTTWALGFLWTWNYKSKMDLFPPINPYLCEDSTVLPVPVTRHLCHLWRPFHISFMHVLRLSSHVLAESRSPLGLDYTNVFSVDLPLSNIQLLSQCWSPIHIAKGFADMEIWPCHNSG